MTAGHGMGAGPNQQQVAKDRKYQVSPVCAYAYLIARQALTRASSTDGEPRWYQDDLFKNALKAFDTTQVWPTSGADFADSSKLT
eukprot:2534811-Rhodomonas_salina.2